MADTGMGRALRRLAVLAGALALVACGEGEDTGAEGGDAEDPAAEGVAGQGTSAQGGDGGTPTSGTVDQPVNRAPAISGTPPGSVVQGHAYSFAPMAADADGDALIFGITNAPAWATFDPSTGRLSGTPTAADLATYDGIVISVTDGEAQATLAPFSIAVLAVASGSATLSWTAPTEKADGSPLTNLAGFNVYWGPEAGTYPNQVTLDNPGLTTYVVDNLAVGTWYFVTTAFDSNGLESGYSNEASKTIQ